MQGYQVSFHLADLSLQEKKKHLDHLVSTLDWEKLRAEAITSMKTAQSRQAGQATGYFSSSMEVLWFA